MRLAKWMATVLALAVATTVQAQPVVVADSGDSAWVIVAAVLTLLAALPGLALLNGRGHTGPVGLGLVVSTAIVSLLFAIIGYSLAFGPGTIFIGDAENALLANLADLRDDMTISETLYVLFELTMAVFATAILVSALAERARFAWLMVFAGVWFMFVYVPVAHWMSVGWLAELGATDAAGGLMVQVTAGVGALIAALLLGRPRTTEIAHDSRLALAGMALVWIGWFGVIGGAELGADDAAATAILNAQMAASAAALFGLVLERWRTGTVSPYGATTAAIAGLAAISCGASEVGVGGAIGLGVMGAIGATLAAMLVQRLKLGSAASAFVAHGGGGIIGALALPVFMHPALGGVGYEEGTGLLNLLTAQGVAVIAISLWTAGLTAVAALMVAMVLPMRAGEQSTTR
jgi:ammonium transporter, Amt family